MSTEIEYELTYLASRIPKEINGQKPKNVVDVYFPSDIAIHPHLRLRKNGDRYELTKKVPLEGSDSSVQTETTIELDQLEYTALKQASARLVEKDRYKVVIADREAEVDVFKGELKGLVLIDFEFPSREEMNNFEPPEICLADVTQEIFIAGGHLAGRSYSDIEESLNQFYYQKICD